MNGLAACLTVSQLNDGIRELLEEGYPFLQVRGEIADWKTAPSGHIYFTLFDANSRIRAVIWKTTRPRLTTQPGNGDGVVITGRIAVYAPRGEYQLIVEGLRADGSGAERDKLLALHARLAAEGLFLPTRKRPIPMLPAAIGVVTSAAGAALHDILHTLERRFPAFHLLLAPARVQGEGAPEAIVQALMTLNRDGRAEVILCGRGGGSADDLSAFNNEKVVRAIANSRLPVISAVGHEIDLTLADLAADARASTPTAAAEMAMPEQTVLLSRLHNGRQRLHRAITGAHHTRQQRLDTLRERLIHPRRRIEQARLRCNALQQRLQLAMRQQLKRCRQSVTHPTIRLHARAENRPLAIHTTRLLLLTRTLTTRIDQQQRQHLEKHRLLQARLTAISPLNVLTRGYALVQDAQGAVVRDARHHSSGDNLTIILAHGALMVRVTGSQESRQ